MEVVELYIALSNRPRQKATQNTTVLTIDSEGASCSSEEQVPSRLGAVVNRHNTARDHPLTARPEGDF